MDIRLYNTMTRRKEVFTPADPARVTMYVCGPTVYNRAHIGNARPAVVFDVLARLLRHKYGAEHVTYARNITDIEDKIIASAAAEGVPINVITNRFADHYRADMRALGVLDPDIEPLATQHVPQMVAMIAKLIEGGHAYAADGHVLFDVPSWPDYGKLSRMPLDQMRSGARVEVAPYKRADLDFVLWKPSSADQPGWESPWGRGRPGWHIECSAMIEEHFGDTIDIHGGGIDLQFPHHENEIAQSVCAHGGAPLARIWMHNGFLDMSGEKMSKSLGNVTLIEDLLAAGHRGEVLRLALLMGHYRQPLDWTDGLIAQAKATLDRWYGLLRSSPAAVAAPHKDVTEALANDLATPAAIAALSACFTAKNVDVLKASGSLLGLLQQDPEDWFTHVINAAFVGKTAQPFPVTLIQVFDGKQINERIAARALARANRNFHEGDRIRKELEQSGVTLEDRADGTTGWRYA